MFTSTDKSCFQPETEKPYLAVAKVIVKIHGKMLKLKKKNWKLRNRRNIYATHLYLRLREDCRRNIKNVRGRKWGEIDKYHLLSKSGPCQHNISKYTVSLHMGPKLKKNWKSPSISCTWYRWWGI